MIEIFCGLWVAKMDEINYSFIKEKEINIIINSSRRKKINFNNNNRIEILDFPIHESYLIKSNFDIILEYIYKNILNGKNIVIYCVDGEKYSMMLILLYLMKYGNINRNKAIKLLQSKLDHIFHLNKDMDIFLCKNYM